MAIPVSGVNSNPDTWLTFNEKPLLFQENTENSHLKIVELSTCEIEATAVAPKYMKLQVEEQYLSTNYYGLWSWRPEDHAGLYTIQVSARDYPTCTTHLRVFPLKISEERFAIMLEELSATAVDLLFRLRSPALEKTTQVTRYHETSALHDYEQLHHLFTRLQAAFLLISAHPHSSLHSSSTTQHWHQIRRFSPATSPSSSGALITLPAQQSDRYRATHLPEYWTLIRNERTYDVYENQLLKQFIQKQLVTKLHMIQKCAEIEIEQRKKIHARNMLKNRGTHEIIEAKHLKQVIKNCQEMQKTCISWSNYDFLRSVKPHTDTIKATQVLLKNPFYSRFYQLYLQFQRQLKFTVNTENFMAYLAIRKISEIYEIWSVFQLTRWIIEELQANGFSFVSDTIFFYEIETHYFQFDVRKNYASIILQRSTTLIEIKYEPSYPNYQTNTLPATLVSTIGNDDPLTPDMAIEINEPGKEPRLLIFDAKYRLKQKGERSSPKEGDINKMLRYWDKIRFQRDTRSMRPPNRSIQSEQLQSQTVYSANIIYPGNSLYEELDHKIWGLPLVPGMSEQELAPTKNALYQILFDAHLIDNEPYLPDQP